MKTTVFALIALSSLGVTTPVGAVPMPKVFFAYLERWSGGSD